MWGNIHPNPGPIFLCLVCAGNVTWRDRSVLGCTCSKWVHLRYSLLSFFRFKALCSFHSWSCPLYYDPAFSGGVTSTNIVTSPSGSSRLHTFTVQLGPSGPFSPMQRSCHTLPMNILPFFHLFCISFLCISPRSFVSGCSRIPHASSSSLDFLWVLQ